MASHRSKIPIIDMARCSMAFGDDQLQLDDFKDVSRQLMSAFSSSGFAYMQNTAVSETLIESVNSSAKAFFELPIDAKRKYKRMSGELDGYSELEQEMLDNQGRSEYKESFDFAVTNRKKGIWPEEISGFGDTMMELFEQLTNLSQRILRIIAFGLELDHLDFFKQCHNISTNDQLYASMMRVLYYPPLISNLEEGKVKLGEHTDYGTITLLFQDDTGGLQVHTTYDEWIDAVPIPGTVLVNIGDLLQRWTSDRLVSTPHRIVNIPTTENQQPKCRQSIAFFVNPDPDTEIVCLDSSGKYEPFNAGKFVKTRDDAGYKYK